MSIHVEVCINSTTVTAVRQNVAAALRGGADTVELCSHMELDGLTPAREHIRAARAAFGNRPGLMVMLRPRGGDFCYTPAELEVITKQMGTAVDAGADGVVFGMLRGTSLARAEMAQLTGLAHEFGLTVTCHRAFDAVTNGTVALEELIQMGIDRVLTNGTLWGSSLPATAGVDRLKALIHQADTRLEIVIGGGLSVANVPALLAQLPLTVGRMAIHAYSSLLDGNEVSEARVARLVQAVSGADSPEQ